MPSDSAASVTGQCYCGATRLSAAAAPLTVAYCHCADCRRWTGAPVGAFAAFDQNDLATNPALGDGTSHHPGVRRWNCGRCGSPLAATFDYLPGQVYVPIGVLDQADDLPPLLHCHADKGLRWLHIADGLDRAAGSGRNALNSAGDR
ncbi:GFA family protein [Ruegeria hyattellae]|uniref:GFA family protein n=1 Tax=Ruegeria hyattellae TaxID=3233337 RepID=UPI00355B0B7B